MVARVDVPNGIAFMELPNGRLCFLVIDDDADAWIVSRGADGRCVRVRRPTREAARRILRQWLK